MTSAPRLPYIAAALLSGLMFGAGLYVSQMIDPLKVLRFLDVSGIATGDWDPSLAFVIVPAIAAMFVAMQIGKRRGAPLFASQFHEPDRTRVDAPLVAGAVLFGIGWGMAGICPGPAIALIAFIPPHLWIFLLMMLVGSFAGRWFMQQRAPERRPA